MKKVILLSFWALTAFTTAFAQTVRTVSNAAGYNNGVVNSLVYNDLQTCIDAANAGDIIYVQGSGISYGNITITKSLALIGPGYFIGQNAIPNTQALAGAATLGDVTFTSACSNGMIKGFVASNILVRGASQIIIQNNYCVSAIYLKNSNNCIIKQNYCGVNLLALNGEWASNSGIIIQNNIFGAGCYAENATVTNNIFDYDFSGDVYYISNSIVKNNIFGNGGYLPYLDRFNYFYNRFSAWYSGFSNSTVAYNVFPHTPANGSATNTYNADINTLFVGYPTSGYSADGKFQLKAGSPAIGAGEDGVDCGAFGGTEPYKLSGMGFNPNIFKVQMPNTGTSQGGLPVKVQIQANQ